MKQSIKQAHHLEAEEGVEMLCLELPPAGQVSMIKGGQRSAQCASYVFMQGAAAGVVLKQRNPQDRD